MILYLLYRKTGRFFAEHLIFTLHVHAFAFVALIISLMLPHSISWVIGVWIPAYLFIAMRTVYEESRARTAVKFSVLVISYNVMLFLAMLGVLVAIFSFR